MKKRIFALVLCLLMVVSMAVTTGFAEEAEPTPEPAAEDALDGTATPEETAEPTATPEVTAEPTATPEVTAEPTATPEVTAEPTATPEVTAEPTATPEVTAEPTVTPEVTTEPTATPEVTPEPTATPEVTEEPTATPEVTPEPTETPAVTACETCGQENCTSDHTNWCETCKKDDCGQTHIYCVTCQIYDCGVDHSGDPVDEPVAILDGNSDDSEQDEELEDPEQEISFCEQLLAAGSLADLRDLMMAEENLEAVKALAPDELAAVKSHVEALYSAVSEPSEDDTYYYNELLETIAVLSGDLEILTDEIVLYVNSDYNSETDGFGTTRFNNYAAAYAYATNNNSNATIVIEKTTTLSGNTFDNNHKNYSRLKVVIKEGAEVGNALSKWDMTYPVTVEAGGTLTMARPSSASVSNMHIKNKLTIGEIDGETAYANFLSDNYQDGDMSIRYNGSVTLNNAVMYVQDLDAQGKFTATNSTITVDGAFASSTSTFYATTLTNSTMTVGGTLISGGLSDFSGGAYNQLGKVTMTDSTITFGNGEATNVAIAGAVTLNGSSSINCKTIELTTKNSSLTLNDNLTTTAEIKLAESLQEDYELVYNENEATRTYKVQAKQYTITYELDGGTFAEGTSNPVTYTKNSAKITLINPTRAGYTFAGWTGTDLDEASTTVTIAKGSTGDRSYTATWTENEVTIYYEVIGDEDSGSVTVDTETIGAATGTVQGSAATAANQYRFVGWYSDAECTTPVDDDWVDEDNKLTPQKNDEDIYEAATYYAKFERSKMDLTISLSGGNTGTAYLFTLTGGEGVSLTLAARGGETVTVKDLPVGEYTITPDNNWNWRETVSVTVNDDSAEGDADATISSESNGNEQWFNSYAYAKK